MNLTSKKNMLNLPVKRLLLSQFPQIKDFVEVPTLVSLRMLKIWSEEILLLINSTLLEIKEITDSLDHSQISYTEVSLKLLPQLTSQMPQLSLILLSKLQMIAIKLLLFTITIKILLLKALRDSKLIARKISSKNSNSLTNMTLLNQKEIILNIISLSYTLLHLFIIVSYITMLQNNQQEWMLWKTLPKMPEKC